MELHFKRACVIRNWCIQTGVTQFFLMKRKSASNDLNVPPEPDYILPSLLWHVRVFHFWLFSFLPGFVLPLVICFGSQNSPRLPSKEQELKVVVSKSFIIIYCIYIALNLPARGAFYDFPNLNRKNENNTNKQNRKKTGLLYREYENYTCKLLKNKCLETIDYRPKVL